MVGGAAACRLQRVGVGVGLGVRGRVGGCSALQVAEREAAADAHLARGEQWLVTGEGSAVGDA